MRIRKLGAALLVLFFVAGSAQAMTLSSLLGGGSITAGDKQFDNWTSSFVSSDGRSFDATNIDITGLSDGGTNPGPGLNFAVSNGELTVTGDDIFAFVDLTFSFHVSSLTAGLGIDGVTLDSLLGSLLRTDNGFNDLGMYVRESVGTAAGLSDLGFTEVGFDYLGTRGTTSLVPSGFAGFAPHSDVWVTKNILVWAVDSTDTASLQGFRQRFAQTPIPQPATLSLVALALLGLAASRRRRSE